MPESASPQPSTAATAALPLPVSRGPLAVTRLVAGTVGSRSWIGGAAGLGALLVLAGAAFVWLRRRRSAAISR
jgi:uncharacterized protein (TIGR03382 family)